MKKTLLITLVVLLIAGQAFAQGVDAGFRRGPGVGFIPGQGKYPQDPDKTFRLVRYCCPEALSYNTLSASSIVIWSLLSDDGITVTTTTTSGETAVAGVIVMDVSPDVKLRDAVTVTRDVGNHNWTWLQTYGKAMVQWQGNGAASLAGEAFGTSTDPGMANTFTFATGASVAQGIAGFVFSAHTAATAHDTIDVFLKCE